MDLEWSDKYPSPKALRFEARAMVQAFRDALLARVPAEGIAGIYFKGSAQKPWDSPLDYVPELSDVDIHVLFGQEFPWEEHLDTMDGSLGLLAEAEKRYDSQVPRPIHLPLPQLTVVNWLTGQLEYVPAPEGCVEPLFGDALDMGSWPGDDRVRAIDRQNLLQQAESVQRAPLRTIDKPGDYMRFYLRGISWRVSPTCSRVLSVLGCPPGEAWSLNRTQGAAKLEEYGQAELADDYRRYYLAAWDYFLSGYADSAAARAAAASAVAVLTKAIALAEKTQPAQ